MKAKHHPSLSIVYVGNDESVIAAFQQLETIRFRTFKNTYETFKGLEEIEPIDALVCENDLPGQSGLSFYDQFFQHFERKAKIQFILISDYFSDDFIKKICCARYRRLLYKTYKCPTFGKSNVVFKRVVQSKID